MPIPSLDAKQLPDLGNHDRTSLSVGEELLIGEIWMQKIRAANLLCNEAIIHDYLNNLGQKLASHTDYRNFEFKFFCIADYSLNAFAFFGSHIGVHKGLIIATETENELAAAIAHEIAHATQQHLLRTLLKNQQYLPVTVAGAIASGILGVPDLAIPILATHTQRMINYTREHEQEADNIGMQLLAAAGFEPNSMPNLFAKMQQQTKYNDTPPEYLLTHPIFETRIASATARCKHFKYSQHPSSQDYHFIKAMINAQNPNNKQETLANLQQSLATKRYSNKNATLFGYALALANNNQLIQANQILAELAAQYPKQLIIQLSYLEGLLAVKDPKAAILLAKLLKLFPNSPAMLLKAAEYWLNNQQLILAKQALTKLLQSHKFPDPMAYRMLATAEGQLGNIAAMHLATAQWNMLYGDHKTAIMQFEQAQKLASDPNMRDKITVLSERAKEMLKKHL